MTKLIEQKIEEFESKYGAFEFSCPETDTISKPQMKKYTDWLRSAFEEVESETRENTLQEMAEKVKELQQKYYGHVACDGFCQGDGWCCIAHRESNRVINDILSFLTPPAEESITSN